VRDIDRIAKNVQKLQSDGKSDMVADYLKQEGMTPDSFVRNYSRAQATGDIDPAHYGPIEGGLANLSHGLFFGWDPEIAGATNAVIAKLGGSDQSFHDLYSHLTEAYRQSLQGYKDENPTLSAYESGTGAAIPGAAAILASGGTAAPEVLAAEGAGTEAPSVAGQIAFNSGKGMVAGGTAGAVAGAGEAGPGRRGSGTLWGGLGGTAVGGVLAPVLSGVANLPSASRALGATKDWVSGELETLGQRISALRGAPPTANAAGAAAGSDASSVAPEDIAILRALQKDGVGPLDVARELQAASAANQPMTLADAGNRATLRLARNARSLSDEAQNAIDDALQSRGEEQPARVMASIEPALGQARNTDALASALMAKRSQDAKPFYETAYQTGPLVDTDLADTLRATPDFQTAHETARGMKNGINRDAVAPLFDSVGNLTRAPTVEDIDLIKKGVDSRLYNNNKPGMVEPKNVLDKETQAALNGALRGDGGLLDQVDALAPAYAAARAQYSGDTLMIKALENGRDFTDMNSREVQGAIDDMDDDDGQKMMFRLGAVDAVRQQINSLPDATSRARVVNSVWGSQDKRDALQAAFPNSETFNAFREQMQREANMDFTARFVQGGSNTVDKGTDAAKAMIEAGHDLAHAVGGNPVPIMTRVMSMLPGAEQTQTRIGQRLFQPNGPDLQAYLAKLSEVAKQRAASVGATTTAAGAAPAIASADGDVDGLVSQ
jgi:hypothetical protein